MIGIRRVGEKAKIEKSWVVNICVKCTTNLDVFDSRAGTWCVLCLHCVVLLMFINPCSLYLFDI